jgi:hypothetical protein
MIPNNSNVVVVQPQQHEQKHRNAQHGEQNINNVITDVIMLREIQGNAQKNCINHHRRDS